ncbi:unnamed protein product [Coccothraustes coccothraustes]
MQLRRGLKLPPPLAGCHALRPRSVMAAAVSPAPSAPPPITVLRLTDRCPSHWIRGIPPLAPPLANGTRASVIERPPPARLLTNRSCGSGRKRRDGGQWEDEGGR